MLFYYLAAAANDNNWLHDWFVQVFQWCMDAVDSGTEIPSWDVLTEDRIAELHGRPTVRTEFFDLVDAYQQSSPDERIIVRQALKDQTDIALACSTGVCVRVSDLPQAVATAALAFGDRLFNLLSELGIRKVHYQQIWNELDTDTVCPFCGYHDLDAPELPAEDLDHYLSRRIYPFAAACLHNLAPMCSRCNMRYKGRKDVLCGVADVQRHYPYDVVRPAGRIGLSGTTFFANGDSEPPRWVITLVPQEKAAEWDRIFDVRARYRRSILDRRWLNWLEEWVDNLPVEFDLSLATAVAELDHWSKIYEDRGIKDKSFLRSEYLALVRDVLASGDEISEQLLGTIGGFLLMRRQRAA